MICAQHTVSHVSQSRYTLFWRRIITVMETFQIAHIRVQGVSLIVVFVGPSLGHKPAFEQQQVVAALQQCARSAGLAGNVVPVWQDTSGRLNFIAPPNQHPYFRSVTFEYLRANINNALHCG
jgi:hypothetical protein